MGLQSERSILGADKCLRQSWEEHQLHEYQISVKRTWVISTRSSFLSLSNKAFCTA